MVVYLTSGLLFGILCLVLVLGLRLIYGFLEFGVNSIVS